MTTPPAHAQFELFFCYSHHDRELRDQLERHLAMLKRTGVISAWHDRAIGAGSEWAGEIDDHLERADIVLLLVSADFLSSDYCYDVELRRAMERHASGTARVIPVILRAVHWAEAPFSRLQAVPSDGRPVTSWTNRDEAFADVAAAIRVAISQLTDTRHSPPVGAVGRTRPSYYPVAQRQLVEESTRTFVGRTEVQRAFDRFLTRHPRGYFVVEGAPGEGKTALTSKLVKDRVWVHHFVNRTGRRSDPRLVLYSLLEQLGAPAPHGLGTLSLAQSAVALEETLRATASEAKPVVVAIDALNELDADVSDELPFLPTEGLPAHAYFFVTSQPGERLEGWKDHLGDIPHEVYRLGPLDTSEAREMITSRLRDSGERVVTSIVDAAQGNPLYIRAALDACERDATFDPAALPPAVEGYFRRATRKVAGGGLLRDVLGLLAVSRKALSLLELSELTGTPQRRVYAEGILPVQQFLIENGYHYAFYHQRFHDFVVRDVVYEDEQARYHAMIAEWLDRPSAENSNYRWSALTHHLFSAGARDRLIARVDEGFLVKKLQRFGYGVLEDIELVARSLLEAGDPLVVERCVALVDGLRPTMGNDLVDDVAKRVQPNRLFTTPWSSKAVEPVLGTIPGLDLHAVMLPKGTITADFIEVVPLTDRLVVAIGDAPSTGLKSAFVARFIASVFRRLVETTRPLRLGRVLTELNRLVSAHDYFERVSMQCIEIVPADGLIAIASAGHPYPVLYSRSRGKCDALPVRGPRLHGVGVSASESTVYEERHAEIAPGDAVVMMSDGLTEGGLLAGTPYGYRFCSVVEEHAGRDARSICHAILKDWQTHPRDPLWVDDTAIIAIVVTTTGMAGAPHAH